MRASVLTAVLVGSAVALGFGLHRAYDSVPPVSSSPTEEASEEIAPDQVTIPPELPEFVIKDDNNQPRSISEWKGKSLVINFWATWCPPCIREIPLLKTLHAERANQHFQVIGIAIDRREDVLAYMRHVNIDYPVLIGEQDALDVATKFGVGSIGLPFTVFTDEKGRIVTLQMGELKPQAANDILDTVLQVNRGTLSLAQAQQKIAAVAGRRP